MGSTTRTLWLFWCIAVNAAAAGCGRRLLRARVIGLMATKDDAKVMTEWLEHNMGSLAGLAVFDSSRGTETQSVIEAYVTRCGANITYHREDELAAPLVSHSDQAVRYWPLRALRERWGVGRWVMVAHADEFWYHEPELVARAADTRMEAGLMPRCQVVSWYAPQVVPHPSEYERYIRSRRQPVQTLFQHFHTDAPGELVKLEARLFLDDGRDYVANSTARQGTVPAGLTPCRLTGPAYLHYKVVDPDPAVYDSQGRHRSHWTGHGAPGVGFGHDVSSIRDFFVEHFRRFTRVYRFEGCLSALVPEFPGLADFEPLRVDRVWPLAVGDGTACPTTRLLVEVDAAAAAYDQWRASHFDRRFAGVRRCRVGGLEYRIAGGHKRLGNCVSTVDHHAVGFDAAPVVPFVCPRGKLRVLGEPGSHSEKHVCALDALIAQPRPCVFISVGSSGNFVFEAEIARLTPARCAIETFDCTGTWSVPKALVGRVRLHQVCLDTVDHWGPSPATSEHLRRMMTPPAVEFLSWPSLLRRAGLPPGVPPTFLKMDCEGCEATFFRALARAPPALRQTLPPQIAVEVHYPFGEDQWAAFFRRVSPFARWPLEEFVAELRAELGYFIADRNDCAPQCCSELLLARTLAPPAPSTAIMSAALARDDTRCPPGPRGGVAALQALELGTGEADVLLSIVLPTYNAQPGDVSRHVVAVARASRSAVELIVVDDGSAPALTPAEVGLDRTASKIRYRFARITVDIPWNVVGAKNLGAALARGRWLLFLDADIVAPAGAIDAMVGRLEAGGDLAAGDAWVFARRQAGGQIMARGPHPAVVLLRRHDFWARVGGMAEDFAGSWGTEDTLLKMQVKLFAPRLPVAPKVILHQHHLWARHNSTRFHERNGTRNRLHLVELVRERIQNSAAYTPLAQCVLRFPYELVGQGDPVPVALSDATVRRHVSTSVTPVYWIVVATVIFFIVPRYWNARYSLSGD